MKLLVLALLLIGWVLATIFLTITFIGIIVVADEDWMGVGKKLLDAIINGCD